MQRSYGTTQGNITSNRLQNQAQVYLPPKIMNFSHSHARLHTLVSWETSPQMRKISKQDIKVNISSFYEVQMLTGASLMLILLFKQLPLEKLLV